MKGKLANGVGSQYSSHYPGTWYIQHYYRWCAHTTFEQDQDGTAVPSWSCSKAVYKPVWHIPLLSVQWINSWWWTEELPETRRVSCRNKFVKLILLQRKFVTMHGQINVKKTPVKTVCGSDEPHPYPVRSSTYLDEQARANEVQRVILYSTFVGLSYKYGVCSHWQPSVMILHRVFLCNG
jgi:hypothetical protein